MEPEYKSSTSGNDVTVGPANPLPVSVVNQTSGYTLLQTQYVAVATKATYNTGDFITRLDEYNALTVPPVFESTTWINNTQGTTLASAPPSADIVITTGVSAPTGGVGIRGWLSGIYNRLSGVVLSSDTSIVGSVKLSDGTNTLLYKNETGRSTIIQTPVIQSFHQKIHDSLGFAATALNSGLTVSATTGSCVTLALVTGSAAGGEIHLKPRDFINALVLTSAISSTAAGTGAYVTATLFEAPSSVTLGSAGTVTNRDRSNPLTPNCTFYPLASARVGGTQIMQHICSPNGSYSSGNSWDADQEFILAPNTTYVFQVTNTNSVAVNGSFQVRLLWYEV